MADVMTWRHYWQMQTGIVLFIVGVYLMPFVVPHPDDQPPPMPINPIRIPGPPPPIVSLHLYPSQSFGERCLYVLTYNTWAVREGRC